MPEELNLAELWQLAAVLMAASDECLLRANATHDQQHKDRLLHNANEFAREADRVARAARLAEVASHA